MAKLYFRYGAMGSSKTANALMTRYNYIENGKNVVMLKPALENRDGEKTIKSRIGLSAECIYIEDFIKNNSLFNIDAIIVDEAQFLTAKQVDWLSNLVDFYNITVLCYGLRTDFQTNCFEGSKRLFELADVIEEIPTICWCGKRAQINARVCNGSIIKHGEQISLGGNESYVSLCRKHYKEKKLRKD